MMWTCCRISGLCCRSGFRKCQCMIFTVNPSCLRLPPSTGERVTNLSEPPFKSAGRRMWYWRVWSTPPFVASSSPHRALNCLESNVLFILHSPGFLFFNSRERQKQDQRLMFWRAHVTSVQYFLWFTRRHLCRHAVVCTVVSWRIFNAQLKLRLYSLFCSCLFVWTISDPRVCLSLKCFTVERAGTNGAKSKLCNWILRGWLGIADLAVIKTTLFTLVLHHGYSKTADWPQMRIYTVAAEDFYNRQIGSTGGSVR